MTGPNVTWRDWPEGFPPPPDPDWDERGSEDLVEFGTLNRHPSELEPLLDEDVE